MKNLAIALLLIIPMFLHSCFASKALNKMSKNDSLYLIKSIDSVNNWYIIYAIKMDSTYKIVVKKEKPDLKCKRVIMTGESYRLELHSRKNEVPVINGIKISPINRLDIQCYTYEENTVICIDPEKGIYDLYHTPNIKGLCYISGARRE
jgi:hypothetical protein